MHNIRHFYYQNKEKIWKVVLIIAFLLCIIYYLNRQAENEDNSNSYISDNVNYSDTENKIYIEEKSPISGGSISNKNVETIKNTISKFLKYCKEENYQQAYEMISSDCKELKYSSLEKFTENYAKIKIKRDAVFEIQKWKNNTYRINISEDILSTGDLENNSKLVEYITIVEENSQEKLNISGYIGNKNIEKEATQKDIKITVISKNTYMDYEIYKFKIENKSNKTIKLDALQKVDTIYLEDSDGYKYAAYSNEILEPELEIIPKAQYQISIKFLKRYESNSEIRKIVFSNLILDFDKYKKDSESQELYKFEINL